ncbi:MAG: tetratricopeptide repeat protein [Bacteroidetes bacterium]|nr:tetratricopeptide repeat protein [Bacteroidota bacterium]
MKRLLFLLLLGTITLNQAKACGNYFYALDKEGRLIPLGFDWRFPFNKNFNLRLNVTKLHKLEQKLKQEHSYMLLSDYALCLLKIGRHTEALNILAELYKHYPSEYKLASNLGTAYEINGQNDSALKYIKRGLQLNPNDHEGSEWIHVKILETKNELRKNTTYLQSHSILGLSDKQKNDSLVLQQLSIQLQERVPFTPAPDPMLADLFNDLGDLSANVKSIEYARAYYLISQKYYGNPSPAIGEKIKAMEKLMRKYTNVHPSEDPTFEGSKSKIGYFRYTDLLKDNDTPHYPINWKDINTDVAALLSLVDFSKQPEVLKESAGRDTTHRTDELHYLPEHAHAQNTKPDSVTAPEVKPGSAQPATGSGSNSNMWIYGLCAIGVAAGAFVIARAFRR